MFSKHCKRFLLLFCCLATTFGLYVGTNNVLTIQPPKETEISTLVLNTADWVANNLNISDEQLELEAVEFKDARIVEGIYYEVGVQFSNYRDEFIFQFVKPTSQPDVVYAPNTLPSSDRITSESGLVSSYRYPVFEDLALQGPIHIEFPTKRDDLSIRVPHQIEAFNVKRLRVNSNVNLKTSGITSLSLVEPLELELRPIQQDLNVTFKTTPRISVTGKSLRFTTETKAKVRKIGYSDIEISNATTERPTNHMLMTPENPLTAYLKHMLQHVKSPFLKRITTATADAVTIMIIPMELKEKKSGIISDWTVMVTQDAFGNRKIIQSEKVERPNPVVTISDSLLLNSTISDIITPLLSFGSSFVFE